MASRGVNKVIILGNLGADPEIRYTPGGTAVANARVATNESWKDKQSGELQERTEWHNVVFWGRMAEIVGEYLKKGSQVYIEGRLQTRKWQGKDGQDRYTTEIVASDMQMLGGRGGGHSGGGGDDWNQDRGEQQSGKQSKRPAAVNEDLDDDIPF